MDMRLSGKTALVLGASRGLGFAIAEGLAKEGAKVALASRRLDASQAAAARIGAGATGFACDTARSEDVDRLFRDASEHLGQIDILVLNSGGPPPGAAQGVSSEQWRSSFEGMFVNLVRIADLALPGMIERRFGRIISVISSGVIQPIPNLAISNAIRPALVGWMKTLSAEVAAHGVTVNCVAPGRIQTDRIDELNAAAAKRTGKSVDEVVASSKAQIPAGRLGTPEEFAAPAVFLASEAAAFMTGSILRVDGGQISSTT